jgi:hypothetical protein
MKRLLSPYLLGIAVAVGGTACVKGGGASPDPVPSGPPSRWTGTARFTSELVSSSGSVDSSSTQAFDVVTITWVKDPSATPAPPAGGARYVVQSGAVHVSLRETVVIDRLDRCTRQGDGDYPLPIPNPPDAQLQGLELRPDGQYEGKLYATIRLTFLYLCERSPGYADTRSMELSLDIKGTLDGGRMRGEMTPRILTTDVLTSTRKGSWDFAAN